MLTRRENLLIRPWQDRRYIYHREKVHSALPAIDNASPLQRAHVSCKLKKMQREAERCSQIVSENFTLLQHLSNIMRTTRVDHFWEEPPPNFLQRVGIYKIREKVQKEVKTDIKDEERPRTRRERCYGCSPERFQKVDVIPEERIPFPPPKKRLTRKAETPPDWESQYQFRCSEDRPEFRGKVWKKPDRRGSTRQMDGEKRLRHRRRKRELLEESQSIYLSKGGLTLAVKFPSRTEVLMSNQKGTRVIERELCECKSFPKKFSRIPKSVNEITLQSPEKLTVRNETDEETLENINEAITNFKVTTENKEVTNEETSQDNIISEITEMDSNFPEIEERSFETMDEQEIEVQNDSQSLMATNEQNISNSEQSEEESQELIICNATEDADLQITGNSEADAVDDSEGNIVTNSAEAVNEETTDNENEEESDLDDFFNKEIQEKCGNVLIAMQNLKETNVEQQKSNKEIDEHVLFLEEQESTASGKEEGIEKSETSNNKLTDNKMEESIDENIGKVVMQESAEEVNDLEESDGTSDNGGNNTTENEAKLRALNLKSVQENTSQKFEKNIEESKDQEIEKLFQDAENVISELNQDEWLEELSSDIADLRRKSETKDGEEAME